MVAERSIDPTLFDWPVDTPKLFGGYCKDCSNIAFPQPQRCPRCSSTAIARAPLASNGTLWSWTKQHFPPASPPYPPQASREFCPFYLGYVELPKQLRIEARLFLPAGTVPAIGSAMRLVFRECYVDGDGASVIGYGFEPAEGIEHVN